jgi:hypothetical protein
VRDGGYTAPPTRRCRSSVVEHSLGKGSAGFAVLAADQRLALFPPPPACPMRVMALCAVSRASVISVHWPRPALLPPARRSGLKSDEQRANGHGRAVLIVPISQIADIEMTEVNAALLRWEHRIGACSLPNHDMWAHGLVEYDRLVGVAIAASLIRVTAASLTLSEAFKLAYLCAARPDQCRVVLRMWREFVFPSLCRTYDQDESLHSGDTYWFDGRVQLGRSRRCTNKRSGRMWRSKTIWGWYADPGARRAIRERDAA